MDKHRLITGTQKNPVAGMGRILTDGLLSEMSRRSFGKSLDGRIYCYNIFKFRDCGVVDVVKENFTKVFLRFLQF